MRSASILFHPHGTPTIERVVVEDREAFILEANGVAFAFNSFAALEGWSLALCDAVDAARATNALRLFGACREATTPKEGAKA